MDGMWQDAFHERRYVIPMTLLYEWGPGAGGRKQAHQFHDPDDDYLWAAGIWEANPELGPCYTMVTTASSPLMSPIHDRMPALLRPEEMQEWLAGSGSWDFLPFTGPLVVEPCASPLKKRAGNRQAVSHSSREGVYLEFRSDAGAILVTKSLEDMRSKKVRLLNVRTEQDDQGGSITFATVYVSNDKRRQFLEKIERFQHDETAKGRPQNADLINSVADRS